MAVETSVAHVLETLQKERRALRQRHEEGLGGLALVRALSAAMDVAVGEIWDVLAPDGTGAAVVALGGYGRGELSPQSDVDLVVIHAGAPWVPASAQALFYALWDAGFTVGHGVRTIKESLRLAGENLEVETSFLEPRLVAGDDVLFKDFELASVERTRKRSGKFVAGVQHMIAARRSSGGSATSQLEPNIKEGSGGLRDLHVLGWFARVFDELPALVSDQERAHLEAAAETLHRVRTRLHYLTGLRTDVLLFQYQRPIATFLGYADGERPAEDVFMRDLFAATRAVEHVVTSVVAELAGRTARGRTTVDEHYAVEGGRVVVLRPPDLRVQPERALELFALGAPVGAPALAWLHDALASLPEVPWTDAVRTAFLRLLRLGDVVALEAADHAGLLARLLPEWNEVRCQPQRNVYHQYTVDAHLFEAVARAATLARDDDRLIRNVWADLQAPDTLLLAALLHDVGKGTDEDHSVRGERLADEILGRMGLDEPARSTILWLVANHLLLVRAAIRRDLNDENFVVELATRIGEPERARMLFLLSVADGRATGPSGWSPWKAALLSELFVKVLRVIERGELVTRDALELTRLRTLELRKALARHPPELVERHIAGMPRAYLLAFPAATLARHFPLMSEPLETGEIRAHAVETGEPGIYEWTVVALDRPGLFSKASGVLALHGVNILAAQAYTRNDEVAVEVFRCAGVFERTLDRGRWERVESDLRRVLRGRLSLELRLEDKRKAYAGRVRKSKDAPPKVIVDNDVSDFYTVIEVHAPDRIGLLHDITKTLADLALDIHVAKIGTYAEDVVDVFYVRDLDGQKLTDRDHVSEVERALLQRLGA